MGVSLLRDMSNTRGRSVEEPAADGAHLEDIPDGAGCSEIWEHLSDRRERAAGD